jgi:hypothetical protein
MDTFYRTRIFQPLVNACGRRWGFTTWGLSIELFRLAQLAFTLNALRLTTLYGFSWLVAIIYPMLLMMAEWRIRECRAHASRPNVAGHLKERADNTFFRPAFLTLFFVGLIQALVDATGLIWQEEWSHILRHATGNLDLAIYTAGLYVMTCDPAPPQETREHTFDAVPEGA